MLPLRFQLVPLSGLLSVQLNLAADSFSTSAVWHQLPPVPEKAGLGGAYAGVCGGKLTVAGGSNFPQRPPWEGGTKAWHDNVYVLADSRSDWKQAGKLPRPMGYGVSISTPTDLICIGGADATRHYADATAFRWTGNGIQTKSLPPLPRAMAYGCGALLDNSIYVAGGIETPSATNALHAFWRLDLSASAPAWETLEPWPGAPRMLAVAAVADGFFYLISGTNLRGDADGKPVREYLRDVYRYKPRTGWQRCADINRPAVAAPSPAPRLGRHLLVFSGDDGTKAGFKPMEQHPGFAPDLLAYDLEKGTWEAGGKVPAMQLTAPVVYWEESFVVPGGEPRPGVRTSQVWSLRRVNGDQPGLHSPNALYQR